MKNRLIYVSMAALIALAFSGCSGGSSASSDTGGSTSAPSGGSKGGGKHFKIAFVTNNSSDYWTIARKGFEKAKAELPNDDLDFRMPTDGTAATQKSIVDELVANKVDGMAISPVDPANQTDMINDAVKGGMVVFTQDSDAPNSNRACYIGTDNVAAGRQLGEELKKSLPNGGKVYAFVGKKDAQNAKDRLQGVMDAIKGTNITLVDVRTDDTDHTKAKSNVSDVLVKDPDVAGLIGIWSYNGPAIYSAVQDANKVGKVKICCFDEEDQTLAGIKAGAIDATIVQQPFEFGYTAMKMLDAYLNGDKSGVPANKLDVIPTLVIHKAEVDDFKTKLDKLRGR